MSLEWTTIIIIALTSTSIMGIAGVVRLTFLNECLQIELEKVARQ